MISFTNYERQGLVRRRLIFCETQTLQRFLLLVFIAPLQFISIHIQRTLVEFYNTKYKSVFVKKSRNLTIFTDHFRRVNYLDICEAVDHKKSLCSRQEFTYASCLLKYFNFVFETARKLLFEKDCTHKYSLVADGFFDDRLGWLTQRCYLCSVFDQPITDAQHMLCRDLNRMTMTVMTNN